MSRKPMSRTLKASLATGAAVVLLAGVGGTFARWYDDVDVTTGDITAGSLTLETDGDVTYTDGTTGTAIANIATYRMVPGDVVTLDTTVTPTLIGDNLTATLTTELGAPPAIADFFTVAVTVDGDADAVLTPTDSGTAIDVSIVITLPLTTGGEPDDTDPDTDGTQAQNAVLDLQDVSLSLVQNDNP